MTARPESRDTRAGIGPFHAVAGMFIGGMGRLSGTPKIDAVLTLATVPGIVPDHVLHRHLPISYQATQMSDVSTAVDWVLIQVKADRTVLIRSESGRQRPGLVVGTAVLLMGGHLSDALTSVHHANPLALTDFRYVEALRQTEKLLRPHRVSS